MRNFKQIKNLTLAGFEAPFNEFFTRVSHINHVPFNFEQEVVTFRYVFDENELFQKFGKIVE